MKKLDTSALSRITDPKLGVAYKKELYTHTVVLALEEFLSENFRGLIKVKYDKIENTIIKISAEYLAYLIKLLLRQADGRAFITVYASMTQGGLELSFEADEELHFTEREQTSLISAAQSAGFYLSPSRRGFILKADAQPARGVAYVYAHDTYPLTYVFYKAFFS